MSRMADTGRVTTADELLQMGDTEDRYELLRGQLSRMSPAGTRHGEITARFLIRLGTWVEQHNLGLVASEMGFVLATNPDHVRAPDVAFIPSESTQPCEPRVDSGYLAQEVEICILGSNSKTADHRCLFAA